MYQNILVAIDGSETSFLALHEALRLVKEGSQIRVVTVVENPLVSYPPEISSNNYRVFHDACVQEGKNILAHAQRDAHHLANRVLDTQLIELLPQTNTDVAHEILKSAKEYHADLIVIGTHGRRGMKRMMLGSVAEDVIRHAEVPVLTIRFDEKKIRRQAA